MRLPVETDGWSTAATTRSRLFTAAFLQRDALHDHEERSPTGVPVQGAGVGYR